MTFRKVLAHFLQPKAIISAVSVINIIWHVTWVRRVELEIEASMDTGHWPYPAHWNPVAVMFEPFLLLAAALGLLINRWWSVLLALLASGRIIYLLGYLPLSAVRFAHDVPTLSRRGFENVWFLVYTPQPQYLIEVALAVVIFIYAALVLTRSVYSRSGRPAPGG